MEVPDQGEYARENWPEPEKNKAAMISRLDLHVGKLMEMLKMQKLDENTIVIPDRRGNRRIDTLQNIVDNPHVGLLFLIPGVDETLRVNGSAIIVRDDALLERLAVEGSRPNVAVVVTVQEMFFHCPKAFLRGHIWDPKSFISRKELPSLSRMILDQTRPPDRSDAEHERLIAEREAASVETNKCLY